MNFYKFYLNILLALFMIFAGIMHFIKPYFYNRFIPEFLPKVAVNYFVGLIELLLGVGLIYAPFQELAGKGIFLLMIFFLPIHVLDVFKEKPAIGSKKLAIIRIPIQFLLIYLTWYLNRKLMI